MAPEATPTAASDQTATAPAATPTPAPAPAAAPAVPDTGSTQDAAMAQAGQFYGKAQAAGEQYAKDVNIPTTPAPEPHARLLGMIKGLAIGLSAAGTSIGTGGKEGGAREVAQVQGEEQQQKIQAQQAAQAAKNAKLQQDLQVFNTNQQLAQNVFNLATLKNQMTESDLKVSGEKQTQAITGADFAAAHGGMSPDEFTKALAGTEPVAGATMGPSAFFVNNANQQLQASMKVLGADDQYVKNMQAVLADPKATPKALWTATTQLATQQEKQTAATKAQAEKQTAEDASPLSDAAAADQNKRTEARYQVLNPGKPLPDEFKVTGGSTPVQVKRITDSLKDTEAAQGIAATRALTNAMHQEQLDALRGPQGIDPSLQGPDYLAAVAAKDPGQADMVKAYGQGRLVLSSAIARTPQGQALTKQILRAYPQYIAANAEGYQKQYNEFTSGKTGTAINSYKTSLDHLNAAFDNVDKASDIDLNNPVSKVHQQLDVDKEFLSTELAKAVSNGNLTEGEKDGMLKAIDGKILGVATKDKYQNQLRESVRLLQGKLSSYQGQWKSTAVPGSEVPSNLQDAADATQKLAGGGAAPSGKAVSLKAAMALPAMAGKSEDEVRAAIAAQGHTVAP